MNNDLPKLNSGRFPLFLANFTDVLYFALSFKVFLEKGFFDAALVFIVTWVMKKLLNVFASLIYVNLYVNKTLNNENEENELNPFDMEKGRFWVMMVSEWTVFAVSAYVVLRWVL